MSLSVAPVDQPRTPAVSFLFLGDHLDHDDDDFLTMVIFMMMTMMIMMNAMTFV